MAAPSVTVQNTRIDASDSASTLVNIGGGAGPGGEPDILYQGSGGTPEDTSRKIGTAAAGYANTPTAVDISTATGTYQTLIMKYAVANFAALELASVPGIELRLGSGSADYALYDREGSDTYPAKGGFIIIAIDPNISGYRTSTQGTPNFAAADYFGIVGDFTATSKSENLVLSAIDVGDGLTLIGGDGVSTDAQWSDFSDFDAGTLANRYGYFGALEGITGLYAVYGTMQIGSATETDFTDDGVTTVFLDGFFAAGWSGVDVNLSNANSVFDNSNHTYDSRGDTTTTDTRAVYNVTGTSGTATETNPRFTNFAEINLNSAMTFVGGAVNSSGPLDINGAVINDVIFNNATGASAAIWDVNSDPDGNIDNVIFNSSGTGHGLELGTTSPTTINLRNVQFNSYAGTDGSTGNEAIWVRRTSGTVTINILDGGDTPTIRTDGATVNVVNAVVVRVTVFDTADGSLIQDARVLLEASSFDSGSHDGANNVATLTDSTQSWTVDEWVGKTIYNTTDNSSGSITANTATTITATLSGGTDNDWDTNDTYTIGDDLEPGTDILSGLTNASGVIEDTGFAFTNDQQVTGKVRRGTTSPLYKQSVITGTITSSGFDTNVPMVSDE